MSTWACKCFPVSSYFFGKKRLRLLRVLHRFPSSAGARIMFVSKIYSAYKCSYMILMSCVCMHVGMMSLHACVCACVCVYLVAAFNIDVWWPAFVAKGNREYEHSGSFIYLPALSFHRLPSSYPSFSASIFHSHPDTLLTAAFEHSARVWHFASTFKIHF